MSARAVLRAATQQDHDQVDRIYSSFDLTEAAGYRCFLTAVAAAHIPVEDALESFGARDIVPDWAGRKRAQLLRSDLAEMGADFLSGFRAPDFATVPALLGGLYVIEGSRLGGTLLKRSLPPGTSARFLDAPAEPGSWRKLLATIDELVYAPEDQVTASTAAQAVFRVFAAAGHEVRNRVGRG